MNIIIYLSENAHESKAHTHEHLKKLSEASVGRNPAACCSCAAPTGFGCQGFGFLGLKLLGF